jgi:hypothetical protein
MDVVVVDTTLPSEIDCEATESVGVTVGCVGSSLPPPPPQATKNRDMMAIAHIFNNLFDFIFA